MVVLQFKVKKDVWAIVHNSITYLLDIYLECSAANHYTV